MPPVAPVRPDRAWFGVVCMTGAVLGFTISAAMTKWLARDYSISQLLFTRAALSVIFVLAVAYFQGQKTIWRTERIGAHVVRAIFGLIGMTGVYVSFWLLPITDATAINLSAPIFATALSVPLLREVVGIRRWAAVLVGFAGVLVMVRPGTEAFEPAYLIAIASAAIAGLVANTIRQIGRTEDSMTIVFYFMMFSTIATAPTLLFSWRTPDLTDLGLLLAFGIAGTAGQILMTHAYRSAPVAVVAPLEYTALLWAAIIGFVVWDEVLTVWTLAGSVLVIASGLYILHRETVRNRAKT